MQSVKIYDARDLSKMKKTAAGILTDYPDQRIFFLKGNLGAGKTTLIRFFCEILGVTEQVVSPSFALVNIYKSLKGDIYHLDLYRLHKLEEAIDLGIEEYLYSGNYCFIEWPGLIEGIYNSDLLEIDIELTENLGRKIVVEMR
ncbi:MAG: tRNA (adenosine(37)-N6)-threonylcarbamoyltransferase complex ATPase subunit type 1 TsaE [Deltaproteobacteria bacterium]